MIAADLDTMIDAWIECALFCAPEDVIAPKSGEFDATPHLARVTRAFRDEARDHCTRFWEANHDDLEQSWYPANRAGHDLYYTTNHHGCGFWECDYCEEDVGKRLTEAAHKFPERTVYKQRGWFGIE